MSDAADFSRLGTDMFDAYHGGKLDEALRIADVAAERYPDRVSTTAYWRACLLSLLGRSEEALDALQIGMDRGAWWSPTELMKEPDLGSVRAAPRFEAIVRGCADRYEAARAEARPEMLVLSPDRNQVKDDPSQSGACGRECRSQAPPLLLALHWRSSTAAWFAPFWQPAVDSGWTLALPQSSQACAQGHYCWDDQPLAESEIMASYRKLESSSRFDPSRVLLAGASQGGRIAVSLALQGRAATSIPSRGFIAVVPAIRKENIQAWAPLIEPAASSGLRGYIITGERDQFLDATLELHRELERGGLECGLAVVAGMPHTFPDDFPTLLGQAIDFILEPGGKQR